MSYPQFEQAFDDAEVALFLALEAAQTLEQRVLVSATRDGFRDGYRALPAEQRRAFPEDEG
jgi:hypothetical protein